MKNLLLLLVLVILTLAFIFPNKKMSTITYKASVINQPEELGKVNWLRAFDEALTLSEKEQKPVFILFQEVPGCSTCRNYGNNVLSHPLIVEAIETLFIPFAVYNNKGGKDAKVLQYYGEPSWNNPVVRIVGETKTNLVPRLNGNYSPLGVVQTMLRALDIYNTVAPKYLELLEQELLAQAKGTEKATFSMYCFWTGEGALGKLDGVVATEPGFMSGREVVQVEYDPTLISYQSLLSQAEQSNCTNHIFAENDKQQKIAAKKVGDNKVSKATQYRPDREPKYYLSKTHYRYVPMTALQASRANSLIGQRRSPADILSPRQMALVAYIQQHPKKGWTEMIGQDLTKGWKKVMILWEES